MNFMRKKSVAYTQIFTEKCGRKKLTTETFGQGGSSPEKKKHY